MYNPRPPLGGASPGEQTKDMVDINKMLPKKEISFSEEIFTYIYKEYYEALVYFVYRIVNDLQVAEDIVADTYCKLYRELMKGNKFNDEKHVKDWLYKVAKRDALNYLKKKKNQISAYESYKHTIPEMTEEEIRNTRIETEVLEQIYKAINDLPPQCGLIFKLRHLYDLGYKEIAEMLLLSPQTIRNHCSRAIKLIKIRLLKRNTRL